MVNLRDAVRAVPPYGARMTRSTDTPAETFQLPLAAAELYESRFVPAIFADWAPVLLDAVGMGQGNRLLDVACGTGIVARTARDRAPHAHIMGVDLNESMLTVARRLERTVDWQQGDAASLPCDDAEFDVVTCQMAAMFFPDIVKALGEMHRVCRPGGAMGLVVPASIDDQPAYSVLIDSATRHTGPDAQSLLGAYFNRGDADGLRADAEAAGWVQVRIATRTGTARFDSAADFVTTEVDASPLADRIDAAARAALIRDVERELSSAGEERFDIPLVCHVMTGRPSPGDRAGE